MEWTSGSLLGFDLESTTVDPYTALPVSYALVEFFDGEAGITKTSLVNPGIPIPLGATAVHGITDEMASDGESLDSCISFLAEYLQSISEGGWPIVTMNGAFDFTILASCAERMGLPFPEPHPVIDLLVLDKQVDRYRKGKRTLSALAAHYGIELGHAHNAEADVVATVECVLELAKQYPEIATYELDDLHNLQKDWCRFQKQSLSEYFERQGGSPIPDWQMEWPIYGTPESEVL
jgi:DNA polymerase III subunit epsilon